jgi:sulfite reductase beta subunit-like hemoprotein
LLKKVLAHEITHAAMFSYNIDLNHDQEEMLADIISTYGQEIISITNRMFHSIV